MRRLPIAAAALLVAAACAGASPEPSASGTPEESYLVEQIHRAWVREANDVLGQLWSWCGATGRIDSSQWAEHRTITAYPVTNSHAYGTRYTFSDIGYDADLTKIDYGTPSVVSEPSTIPGSRYIYDLRGVATPGKFSQTDKIELSQTRSVTVTHGITLDVSASTETTIKGEYAGVGIEEKLTATFGYTDTTETASAKSESTSVETEHTFDVDLAPGEITYISIETDDLSSSTPVSIRGVSDATVTITLGQPCGADLGPSQSRWWELAGSWLYHPDNEHIWDCWGANPHGRWIGGQGQRGVDNWLNWLDSHPCPWTTTLTGLAPILEGRDAAWQGLAGSAHGRTDGKSWIDLQPRTYADDLAAATLPRLRRVDLAGVQERAYSRGTSTKVVHITDGDIDALVRGGAVVCTPGQETCQ